MILDFLNGAVRLVIHDSSRMCSRLSKLVPGILDHFLIVAYFPRELPFFFIYLFFCDFGFSAK